MQRERVVLCVNDSWHENLAALGLGVVAREREVAVKRGSMPAHARTSKGSVGAHAVGRGYRDARRVQGILEHPEESVGSVPSARAMRHARWHG
jgi:hypothetical protein